jgi:hypothetical protein
MVDRLCASSNLSFAHEMGHNMGAHHDPYVAGSDDTLFPCGHGDVNLAGRVRTIMTYNDPMLASSILRAAPPEGARAQRRTATRRTP